MIKKLTISNFQSHKFSAVEFAKTVTAIVGLNNHGKSAIFRALKKVVRNEPEGTAFIRDGETICEITVETDNGSVVRRVRTDGASDSNLYIAGSTEFAKFGKTGIPEEVLSMLDISPIQSFGTDVDYDLNFQDQLDPLFLIQGAGLPSIRGKVLGRITGIDLVQRGIQNGAAIERRLVQDEKRFKQDLERLNLQLAQYRGLDSLVAEAQATKMDLQVVQDMSKLIETLEQRYDKLVTLLDRANGLAGEIAVLKQANDIPFDGIARQGAVIERLDLALTQLNLRRQRSMVLSSFLGLPLITDTAVLQQLTRSIQAIEKVIHLDVRLGQLKSAVVLDMPDVQDVLMLQQRYTMLAQYQGRVDSFKILQVAKVSSEQSAKREEENAIRELDAFQRQLGVCPLCKQAFVH